MRILRTVILSIGLAALAAACGGKSNDAATTPDNTGGEDMGATGGDTYGAADTGAGDMGGGEGGDMGGGEDPCAGGETP